MRIGLDLDGVVYPYHYSVWKYYTEFKEYAGTEREFWTSYWWDLPKEEQDYIVSLVPLYNDIVPSTCVRDALKDLASLGEIIYITARKNEDVRVVTRKFLDYYDVPFKENLIFERDKATACRAYGIDYFLDDFPSTVASIASVSRAFLMAQSHNIGKRQGLNVVNSLREFYQVIVEDFMTEPGTQLTLDEQLIADSVGDDK